MVRAKYLSVNKSTGNEPQETLQDSQNDENASSHADGPASISISGYCSKWRLLSRKCLILVIIGVICLYVVDIDVNLIFRVPPESTEKKIKASLRYATSVPAGPEEASDNSSVPVGPSNAVSEPTSTTGQMPNAAMMNKNMAATTADVNLQSIADPINLAGSTENDNSIRQEPQEPNPPDVDVLGNTATDAIGAWHPSYQYRYDSEANHFMNSDVLDLSGWESSAFSRLIAPGAGPNNLHGHCNPPPGIPKSCCPGTFSAGGSLDFNVPHECIPALQRLPFLKQHARDWFNENTVPNTSIQCDVCEIVEVARKNSLTVAFVGDSMHHQVFDGFTCELYRRGYNVSLSEYFYPISGNIYLQPHMNKTLHVHSPSWDDDSMVVIQFYQIYKLPVINDGLINITAQADVLITGWGLHWWYVEREGYAIQMAALFQNISQEGHVQLLIHRETSAQHWEANGGEYSLWVEEKNASMYCQPFQYNDSTVMWREKAVREGARQSGHDLVMAGPQMPAFTQTNDRPEVVVLPFFNYTSQHPKMHPIMGERSDCTHYCSTPFVYYPLWRSLRYAFNRQFGRGSPARG